MKENQNYIMNFKTDTKYWSSGQLQKDGVECREDGIFLLNGAGWNISHEDLQFLGINPLPDDFDITSAISSEVTDLLRIFCSFFDSSCFS